MRKAFTLIEMAVVLIILGIVAGISIPLIQSSKSKRGIESARDELLTFRKRIIAYYNTYSRIPSHKTGYILNDQALQIPAKFTKDPLTGRDYLYFADTTGTTDSIYVDGTPLGSIGAVIICAGPNGTFDGENSTPGDFRFQSTGVDDIVVTVSQSELTGGTPTTCTSYTITVTNNYGAPIYFWPLLNQSTYITINNGQTSTFTNISPNTYVLLSSTTGFYNHQTSGFVPAKFNKGNNCTIRITVTQNNNVPVFTEDQN